MGRVIHDYKEDIDKYEISIDLEALRKIMRGEGMSEREAGEITVRLMGGRRNFIGIEVGKRSISFQILGAFRPRRQGVNIYAGNIYRQLARERNLAVFERELRRVLAHETKHALDRKKPLLLFQSELRAHEYARQALRDKRWANVVKVELKK
jgi:hypothetical protein